MALLRSLTLAGAPELRGPDVYLRMPLLSDYYTWAKLREESREFLEPWEPAWSADALSKSAYRRRLKRYARELRDDEGIAFFIFRRADDALVGGITLSQIRRGVTQSCSVGYWMGQRYARRGYMYGAVTEVVRFVFDELRLHRLEAACVPTNAPSMALLTKAGFRFEGLARQFLCINGVWRDHNLFAMLSSDPRPAHVPRLRAANQA
ncbi:MAG: GNAT family N-acetyltransferase [Alphaproteobacteria bacterium]|nr:GNAT family N-acetyltransferase [Alphaproteobacteria bacterium]